MTIARSGVWRSLVARSVRVGEAPSSNLGTPIEVPSCKRAGKAIGGEWSSQNESKSARFRPTLLPPPIEPVARGLGALRPRSSGVGV